MDLLPALLVLWFVCCVFTLMARYRSYFSENFSGQVQSGFFSLVCLFTAYISFGVAIYTIGIHFDFDLPDAVFMALGSFIITFFVIEIPWIPFKRKIRRLDQERELKRKEARRIWEENERLNPPLRAAKHPRKKATSSDA